MSDDDDKKATKYVIREFVDTEAKNMARFDYVFGVSQKFVGFVNYYQWDGERWGCDCVNCLDCTIRLENEEEAMKMIDDLIKKGWKEKP